VAILLAVFLLLALALFWSDSKGVQWKYLLLGGLLLYKKLFAAFYHKNKHAINKVNNLLSQAEI
jgi:hypothetical protein